MKNNVSTLTEKLKQVAMQSPDKIIMQTKKGGRDVKYTYKEFFDYAQSIAYSLLEAGIQKGDKVAIVLENRPEWGFIYFGILFAGAIAVPLDPQSSTDDLEYYLSHSESKIVFTSDQFIAAINKAAKDILGLRHIVLLNMELNAAPEKQSSEKIISLGEFFSCPKGGLKTLEILPDDVASILYTSGTTGKPKGVMLTHKNFYSNYQSIDQLKFFTREHNFLSILPLHHSFPFMATLIIPLFSHNKITYVATLKREELLACMREMDVTILVGVPQFFALFGNAILEQIKRVPFFIRWPLRGLIETFWLIRKTTKINLSKLLLFKIHRTFGRELKYFVCGGAKLNEETELFLNKIGFTLIQGYGLTETSPVVTFNPLSKQKIGSAGKTIPGVEVKINEPDDSGNGEVIIRGPNVMKGYYKREEDTKEALKDGWFYSGDLGFLDKDGYLYLTGRKKELIILSSGKNISPEEVENHYLKCPCVKELCILAIGKEAEEKLVAVIVPDYESFIKRKEVSLNEVIKWGLDNLSKEYPAYKRIMGFVIAKQDLPRTRLGKLKRYLIKEKYANEFLGIKKEEEFVPDEKDLAVLSSAIFKVISQTIKKEAKIERPIKLDDHLEIDLGFDSLSRVEMMVSLEKAFNIKIPEVLMAKIFTARELHTAVEKLLVETKAEITKKDMLHKKEALWNDIVRTDPAVEILNKISLSPGAIAKASHVIFCEAMRLLFKIIWRIKIVGIENLPRDKTFILCSNHTSYLDGFIVAASIPNWLKRRIFFIGFSTYFEAPIVCNVVKIAKLIPIDPGERLIDAMQACAYVLRNDRNLCIFPEAARSIDGEIKSFKKGIGILAKELNVPLVPVYIKGSFESWPRTKSFPKPHPIKVNFGKPHYVEELKKKGYELGAKDDYEAIAMGIREVVCNLSHR